MALEERSRSTRKGVIAQDLVRRALRGKPGPCDINTKLGGFELRWGPTTKNSAGLAHDRARAQAHGGCCVQIAGRMAPAHRRAGDISLYELLKMHGIPEAAVRADLIRKSAEGIP